MVWLENSRKSVLAEKNRKIEKSKRTATRANRSCGKFHIDSNLWKFLSNNRNTFFFCAFLFFLLLIANYSLFHSQLKWMRSLYVSVYFSVIRQAVIQCSYVTHIYYSSHTQRCKKKEQNIGGETKTNLIGSTFNNQLFWISLCAELTVTVLFSFLLHLP